MAGRGPLPKEASKRARRNAVPSQTVLEFEPGPQPPLPAGFPWPARTIEWWRVWGQCPQAGMFGQVDWQFLADTALLHASVWASAETAIRTNGKIDVSMLPELRIRVAKFGATVEDRTRLRILFAQADEKDAKRPERPVEGNWGDLVVLPASGSAPGA